MHGVINLLKPPGMTSHDAVQLTRRATGVKRIGHNGTLDPAAAGVLPLCVGVATRLSEYLQNNDKEYIAESTFGYATDTLDAVGTIAKRQPDFAPSESALESALTQFTGAQQQIPPHYSAIKKDGKKLYELARSGELPELKPRAVQIHEIELLRFVEATDNRPARAMFRIKCGSGTYIRSLIRDIAESLEGCATMTFLVRTEGSGCVLDAAHTVEEIAQDAKSCLIPLPKVLFQCFRQVFQDDERVARLSLGQQVDAAAAWQDSLIAVTSGDEKTIAVARRLENTTKYKPEKVMSCL